VVKPPDKAALAEGFPVVFGTVLFESFARVGADGVIPMPDEATEHQIGRHAMLLCGYNATHFLVQNSWGKNWGAHGYCSIPHAYFVKYAPLDADFWVIRQTTKL
jgi:C1A family cysteine protease